MTYVGSADLILMVFLGFFALIGWIAYLIFIARGHRLPGDEE